MHRHANAASIAGPRTLAYTRSHTNPEKSHLRTTREELVREYRRLDWWSDTRITDLFDAAARSAPSQLAVLDPPNRDALVGGSPLRLTFTDVADLADGYSLRLLELGLKRDDILVTQLPNVAEYPALYLAALRLGIIVSPVPMQFRSHELEQIVDLTGARALLTVHTLKGADYATSAVALGQNRPLQVLCLGADAPEGSLPFVAAALTPQSRVALAALIDALQVSADDVATICWTSGTEGLPKGVPRTHNHWIAISYGHLRGAGIRRGERLLNPFPLINMAAIGGCFMSWLHSAGTLVLHHPLDLGVYLRQIAEEKPGYAIAPPAVLNMLLKDDKLLASVDLSCLRCIGSGSAPLDPEMIRGYQERFGIEIVNLFGSNEGMSLISNASNAPYPEHRARLFPRYGRDEIRWESPPASHPHAHRRDWSPGMEILGEPASRTADHGTDGVRRLFPRATDQRAVVHGGRLVPHWRPVRDHRRRRSATVLPVHWPTQADHHSRRREDCTGRTRQRAVADAGRARRRRHALPRRDHG